MLIFICTFYEEYFTYILKREMLQIQITCREDITSEECGVSSARIEF